MSQSNQMAHPGEHPGGHYEPPIDLAHLSLLDEQIDENILGTPGYTPSDLVELTGWTLDELNDIFIWSGLPNVSASDVAYNPSDREGLILLKQGADREGLSHDEIGTLIRSISFAMAKLATSEIESLVYRLTKRGMSDTAARLRVAEYAPSQVESSIELMDVLWRRHFAAAIHRLTTGALLLRGVSDDDQQFPLMCAVGLARVVDFASVTANFGAADYIRFVQDFNDRIADIVIAQGGRIIKLNGDLVLWVTAQAEASADIALELTKLDLPGYSLELQQAVTWCRIVAIHGHIFGPGVNLVNHLALLAPPGSVLLDDAAVNQLRQNPRFQFAVQPLLDVKGVGEVQPALLSEVLPADETRGGKQNSA